MNADIDRHAEKTHMTHANIQRLEGEAAILHLFISMYPSISICILTNVCMLDMYVGKANRVSALSL